MAMRKALLLILGATAACAQQQTAPVVGPQPGKLALVFQSIVDYAVSGAGPTLSPVLRQSIGPNWLSLNSSVATQLSNLPMPSPASGRSAVLNPAAGTLDPVPLSFGPILTERAETIGKGKFYFAVSHQRFLFDRLDDLSLNSFAVVSPLTVANQRLGLLNAEGYINVDINQTTAHFTYGATRWLDVSYAMPMVTSQVNVRGTAALSDSFISFPTLPLIQINMQSTGWGDGTARFKAKVTKWRGLGVALATDIRLPIGDEFNYHGSGTLGLKETVILSWTRKKLSPHLNAAYQWNGESLLSTWDPNVRKRLPSQFVMAAGFDSALSKRLTLAVDLQKQTILNGQRTLLRPFQRSNGQQAQEIYFLNLNRQEWNSSYGFKAMLREDLLLTCNLLVRLNQTGLRARVIPFLSLSYLF